MPAFLRKAILATAVAGALTGLAVSPASASAPSVKLKVCNATPNTIVRWAWAIGTNQDGRKDVVSTGMAVGAYGKCNTLQGYWWQIDTSLDIRYNTDKKNDQYLGSWVNENSADGSTYQINLGYVDY